MCSPGLTASALTLHQIEISVPLFASGCHRNRTLCIAPRCQHERPEQTSMISFPFPISPSNSILARHLLAFLIPPKPRNGIPPPPIGSLGHLPPSQRPRGSKQLHRRRNLVSWVTPPFPSKQPPPKTTLTPTNPSPPHPASTPISPRPSKTTPPPNANTTQSPPSSPQPPPTSPATPPASPPPPNPTSPSPREPPSRQSTTTGSTPSAP